MDANKTPPPVTVTDAGGRTAAITAEDLRVLAGCCREARRRHDAGTLDQVRPPAEAKPAKASTQM